MTDPELLERIKQAAKGTPHQRMVQLEDMIEGKPITKLVHYYELTFSCRHLGKDRFRTPQRIIWEFKQLALHGTTLN